MSAHPTQLPPLFIFLKVQTGAISAATSLRLNYNFVSICRFGHTQKYLCPIPRVQELLTKGFITLTRITIIPTVSTTLCPLDILHCSSGRNFKEEEKKLRRNIVRNKKSPTYAHSPHTWHSSSHRSTRPANRTHNVTLGSVKYTHAKMQPACRGPERIDGTREIIFLPTTCQTQTASYKFQNVLCCYQEV